MRGINLLGLAVPLIVSVAPVAAFAQAAETKPNAVAKASDVASEETIIAGPNEEEVICKRDKPTGTRVATKRVCKTARLWNLERIEMRRTVERGQNERMKEGN
ncbi:hypothetical protein [Qipengyuania soli]|uniref:Uncharacterized protein n=1 Tax=Qipengyuania soli TaxID=2782568 RepID=A0A7S8IV31_9SPHN|nr:hypothetical protein [Qipengyuania soli]QPC99332.1 hypothetical protein IRL76_01785 [Qipengyuania soli]